MCPSDVPGPAEHPEHPSARVVTIHIGYLIFAINMLTLTRHVLFCPVFAFPSLQGAELMFGGRARRSPLPVTNCLTGWVGVRAVAGRQAAVPRLCRAGASLPAGTQLGLALQGDRTAQRPGGLGCMGLDGTLCVSGEGALLCPRLPGVPVPVWLMVGQGWVCGWEQ